VDTLEFRTEVAEGERGPVTVQPPIIWRGKSPQEVHREQYPDHKMEARSEFNGRRSTRPGVDFCDSFEIVPGKEVNSKQQRAYATLVAIPEKK